LDMRQSATTLSLTNKRQRSKGSLLFGVEMSGSAPIFVLGQYALDYSRP